MKKTDRKNKTGLNMTWPTGIFTIEECHAANPDFINITLRVRIKNAIKDGVLNELGYLHNGKGRPRVVMVQGTITQEHIAAAKSRSVVLKKDLVVNLTSIATPKTEEQTQESAEVSQDTTHELSKN